MATPIRHSNCGEIVMWYVGDRGNTEASSSTIVYLDGTRPMPCSGIPACPYCGDGMYPGKNLIRCFDEDVDPGFDIHAAIENGERVFLQPGPPDPSIVAILTGSRNAIRWLIAAVIIVAIVNIIVAVIR